MKRLSIIIPAYNTEENLPRLLNQIVSQMTDTVETIVVDDGSSDNTLGVARQFAKDGVKVVHQENSGVGPARNRGINESTGDYIWFVDADDTILSGAIVALLDAIEHHPSDYYLFGVEKHFGKNTTILTNTENREYNSSADIAKNFDSIFAENVLNPLWNKLMKRSIIKEHDLRFKNLRSGQDAEFGLRYLSYVQTMYAMIDVLYSYVLMSSTSSSHVFQKTYFADHEAMFAALNNYCSKTDANADGIRARWAYEATMGFYKNVFNSLPERKTYHLFRQRVNNYRQSYIQMMEDLNNHSHIGGLREIISSNLLFSYLFIRAKVILSRS